MELQPWKFYPAIRIGALYTVYILPFDKDFRFPGETHPIWEFEYVISGELSFTSGDSVYRCTQGEAVLHRPDVFHTAWSESAVVSECLTISFSGSGLQTLPDGKFTLTPDETAVMRLLLAEIPPLFSGYNERDYTPLAVTPAARSEGCQILLNLLEVLFLSLQRRRPEAGRPWSDGQARLYADIAGYLSDRVDDALCTDDICRRFALSRSSLKALFSRFTGEGVMQYYRHLRIRQINAYLGAGLTVCEVAEKMHFSSQNYLSSFYHRETGLSPSAYARRQMEKRLPDEGRR